MSNTASDVEDIPGDFSESGEGLPHEYSEYGEEEYLPVSVKLRSEDFISGPYLSDDSTIPENILEFSFSFGYDCKKHFNLTVPDPNTLMFISGNLLHFFSVDAKEMKFRRSALGGGLGHTVKNHRPEFPHVAVAENGENPPIIIYEWPSMEIVALLKGGSSRCFTHMNYRLGFNQQNYFSPDGLLLVSQGGEPDHLITVWDWPKSSVLLRTKSNVNDVYRVKFSPYVPGHLTTCGASHIKFWKMATTFTGLKLQGELGRFGKTEYSDILGIYPMPDEKVISGCHWGNFLVWEAGLIKVEVFRKLRKKCHDGPIVQFDYREGELWTVSTDGRVRVWHYETIDQADPPDDDRVVQMEPAYEFYTPGVEFLCISKRSSEPEDTFYYAQDGQGGLWLIDLTTEWNVTPSVQLYKCHAGAVMDAAACPWGCYLASLGIDGRLHVYDYARNQLIFTKQFPAKGVCMVWLPLQVDQSGDVLILGFDDGNLRVLALKIYPEINDVQVLLLQITKPHARPLTCMSVNPAGNLLVTAGEDSTIFVYQIKPTVNNYVRLVPIGLVPTTDVATCLTWHSQDETTVIIGCLHGFIDLVTLPGTPQWYTQITYRLKANVQRQRFTTYKSQIRRDIKLREIEARKLAKRERKRVEMVKFTKENPGLEVDEEIFLADSESEEELEPLYIPQVPNKILWIQHTPENTLWLSVAGYDAGYIYEYQIDQQSEIPCAFKMVYDADDTEIRSYVYNYNKKYLIFAMENGAVRVNKTKEDFRDLTDYWQLSMHDSYNSFVPKMCFSHDERYFFTCGHDGNVFSYKFTPENGDRIRIRLKRNEIDPQIPHVHDSDSSYTSLSLEEAIVKAEDDRKQKLADDRKEEYRRKLSTLKSKFEVLLKRNKKLLPSQVIHRDTLALDARITENLKAKLDEELALVKRRLAYEVEKSEVGLSKLMAHFVDPLDVFPVRVTAARKNVCIKTLRQRKLDRKFVELRRLVDQKLIEAELKGRPPARVSILPEGPTTLEKKDQALETFLIGLSPSTIEFKLGPKLNRLLERYRIRKTKSEKRKQEWEKFNATQPIAGVNHPDDEAALADAIESIGDYKLKSAHDYKVPAHLRESTVKKYKELLNIREKQFHLRNDFNKKAHEIRDKKVKLRESLIKLQDNLSDVHNEIPSGHHKSGPEIVELHDYDFLERNLEVVVETDHHNTHREDDVHCHLVPEPSGDLLEKEVLPCLEQINVLDESETITDFEIELKEIRLKRKLFEQERTIEKMNNLIAEFDETVESAFNERLQAIVDATFLDLHVLTLNQELLILKDFEAVEDQLSDNVHNIMEEMLDVQDLIANQNYKIDTHKKEIEVLEENGKQIQQHFLIAAQDSKFYDFLRRIFKKKFKPPKARSADDSESSSESSTSEESTDEEEDTGSIDSRDVGPIRLDESVCPKGCDQGLYDQTFQLRKERHGVELEIKEHNRTIDLIRKDIEAATKKIKTVQVNLTQSQDELESYQREKQRKLNEVMCTVVLNLHQLQHILSDGSTCSIKDTLVFSRSILSNLYKRVGELEDETLQQKAKHKINVQHLGRMKTDCKSMESRIHELNGIIRLTLKQKFGREVDLNEVEEALLKRLVLTLRMSLMDIKSMYEEEIATWKLKIGQMQLKLMKTIRRNTSKLELLGLLNSERANLLRHLREQEQKKQHLEMIVEAADVYKHDIRKLQKIVEQQTEELSALREEIKILKLKGFQRQAEPEKKPDAEETLEEEEFELMELDESDECIQIDFSKAFPTKEGRKQKRAEEKAKQILADMMYAVGDEEEDLSNLPRTASDILKCQSLQEIMGQLIQFLPAEPGDEEQGIIETTAERLYALTETKITEIDIARETLKEIMDDVSLIANPYEGIAKMLGEIVTQLPMSFVMQKETLDTISAKISGSDLELDKDALVASVISISSSQRDDIEAILEHILEDVFGTGAHYLYYVKH